LYAGPDACEVGRLLEDLDVVAGSRQERCNGEPTDPGADNRDVEVRFHSIVILALSITCRHFGISRLMRAANASGVLGVMSSVVN
jgi:hypothetical protein